MTDYQGFTDERRQARHAEDQARWRARGSAFWRWLASRSAESWLFFVGGLLIGKVLL